MWPDGVLKVEKQSSILPHALKCFCFPARKKCQARGSSPILEIQFNSRSNSVLTGPIQKAVKVPTGAWSFGHQHQSMYEIVPYFSTLPIFSFLFLT